MKTPILLSVVMSSLLFGGVTAASLLGLFWGLANLLGLPPVAVYVAEAIAMIVSLGCTGVFARMALRAENILAVSKPASN